MDHLAIEFEGAIQTAQLETGKATQKRSMNLNRDYRQISWDPALEADCRTLLSLAWAEDLGGQQDWTTCSLVPEDARGEADVVAREHGIISGLKIIPLAVQSFDLNMEVELRAEDGARVKPGESVAHLSGRARDLLTVERVILNFIGHLSGISTKTDRFCQLAAGSRAAIYDTRKTTLGWRRAEKYAVRCGGGRNHRLGLFDGILIKDNHLALAQHLESETENAAVALRNAVVKAKTYLKEHFPAEDESACPMLIEIEVDTLDQLRQVLLEAPDIVLLDNMDPADLRGAVLIRDELAPQVVLEASGSVSDQTVAQIARTGIDRISVGALTHSASNFDVGLDWI